MRERYDASSDEEGYPWLDEFLCEYVDGTMDPSARCAFEEYLRGNPDLVRHVESLQQARSVLCGYNCRCQAPNGLQRELQRHLEGEEALRPPAGAPRLHRFAAVTSAMALLLLAVALAVPEPDAHVRPAVAATPYTQAGMAPAALLMPSPLRLTVHRADRVPSGPVGFIAAPAMTPVADSAAVVPALQRTRVRP